LRLDPGFKHLQQGKRQLDRFFVATGRVIGELGYGGIKLGDVLNDRVVPFFDEKEVKLSRVLTDRGTEYCGNPEHHEYELYLAVEDIPKPRRRVHKRMASLSASTRQCWTSSIASPSERGSMPRSGICRTTSIYGSKATTRRDRINTMAQLPHEFLAGRPQISGHAP
jgi:hypothetical protein